MTSPFLIGKGDAMSKVENFVIGMIAIANDDRHGYSQYNRWGKPGTWSDYDCSALVSSEVERAGIPVMKNGATYTGNMYGAFIKSGFKDVTRSVNLWTGKGLKRGDVLLNPGYHTEVYIGGGKMVGAKSDERGGIVGRQVGDQTGREICISNYRNYPWTYVLRYPEKNGKQTANQASPKTNVNARKFIKYEKWHGITQATCNVRSAPSVSAPVVAKYSSGQRINYDQVWEGDGYRWISYIANSGQRRYVAYRKLTGNTKPWIKF